MIEEMDIYDAGLYTVVLLSAARLIWYLLKTIFKIVKSFNDTMNENIKVQASQTEVLREMRQDLKDLKTK